MANDRWRPAYVDLQARIRTGAPGFQPGDWLTEAYAASLTGWGRGFVSSALDQLERDGLIRRGSLGARVRELSVREIADQYEIRAVLESYALRTLAGRLTPHQVARVRANLEAQVRLRGSGEVLQGVELDAAFHTQFVEFLGNGEVLRVIVQLREKMQRVVTQVFRLCPARIDTSYDEHAAIAAAAIDGDGERAAELLVRHLELGKQLILSPRG